MTSEGGYLERNAMQTEKIGVHHFIYRTGGKETNKGNVLFSCYTNIRVRW